MPHIVSAVLCHSNIRICRLLSSISIPVASTQLFRLQWFSFRLCHGSTLPIPGLYTVKQDKTSPIHITVCVCASFSGRCAKTVYIIMRAYHERIKDWVCSRLAPLQFRILLYSVYHILYWMWIVIPTPKQQRTYSYVSSDGKRRPERSREDMAGHYTHITTTKNSIYDNGNKVSTENYKEIIFFFFLSLPRDVTQEDTDNSHFNWNKSRTKTNKRTKKKNWKKSISHTIIIIIIICISLFQVSIFTKTHLLFCTIDIYLRAHMKTVVCTSMVADK